MSHRKVTSATVVEVLTLYLMDPKHSRIDKTGATKTVHARRYLVHCIRKACG